MSPQHGHVRLPATYYAAEKRAYSDWSLAWFREAIQNEVDAGATEIDFTIESSPDSELHNRIICHGNGSGMDKDRLFNAFLTMGGSQKEEGNIGGFGQAKVILAFAHAGYTIETQDIRVDGVGGDYTWSEGHPNVKGVRLTVSMDKNEIGQWYLQEALATIIKHSDFNRPVKVKLNGELVQGSKKDMPYKVSTTLGDVMFRDMDHGSGTSVLWVRMNGLAMFRERIWGSGSTAFEGYLDLEGDSKALLTSNRDSLNNDNRDALNRIMQSLTNDREKLKLSGDIDFLLNQKYLSAEQIRDVAEQALRNANSDHPISADKMQDMLDSISEGIVDESAKHPFQRIINKAIKAQEKLSRSLNRIPHEWYPDNFKVKYLDHALSPEESHKHASEIARKMNLKRFGKLACAWDSIVSTLLANERYRNELHVVKTETGYAYRDKSIRTGFVFGSPDGLCNDDAKNLISIMVNPDSVDIKDFTIGDLIDIAHHELTHLMYEHGESFIIKEMELRRIARREIPEKDINLSIDEALSVWRDNHSSRTTKRPQRMNVTDDEYAP